MKYRKDGQLRGYCVFLDLWYYLATLLMEAALALKPYQTEINAGTLYEISKLGGVSGVGAQLQPSIEVIGGAVSIYGSQIEPVTPPTGMALTRSQFTGIEPFAVIPNYLFVSGSPTSIVLTGIDAVEVA